MEVFKSWIFFNEPQSYLKIQHSSNNLYLECFYLVIQVGLNGYEQHFWTAWDFCDLGHKNHSGNTNVLKFF